MYCAATILESATPNNGINRKGNSAVTDKCVASVSHQIATQAVIAAIFVALKLPGSRSTKNRMTKNANGPESNFISEPFFMELKMQFQRDIPAIVFQQPLATSGISVCKELQLASSSEDADDGNIILLFSDRMDTLRETRKIIQSHCTFPPLISAAAETVYFPVIPPAHGQIVR